MTEGCMMSVSNDTDDALYRYNIPPVIKPEYFDEALWLLITNGEDKKAEYDWQGDEVIICSYPRSGTHMTWNMVRYMLQGNTERLPDAMTESQYPPNFRLEGSPQTGSRRVLFSHLLPCQYASDSLFKTGNRKFIYVVRNPNDVAVSTFNMWNAMPGMSCPNEFPAYYEEFITGTTTTFPCCGWSNHVKAWEEYAAKNPDVPIMFQTYEDLHRKPEESLIKIAQFLDIKLSEMFIDDLVEASKFDKMRHNKVDTNFSDTMNSDGNETIYRKGVIGDWKNWLTVQNYELFQKVFPEQSADMTCRDRLVFI